MSNEPSWIYEKGSVLAIQLPIGYNGPYTKIYVGILDMVTPTHIMLKPAMTLYTDDGEKYGVKFMNDFEQFSSPNIDKKIKIKCALKIDNLSLPIASAQIQDVHSTLKSLEDKLAPEIKEELLDNKR